MRLVFLCLWLKRLTASVYMDIKGIDIPARIALVHDHRPTYKFLNGYVASYPGAVPVITISYYTAALKGRSVGSMLPPIHYGELYGHYKTADKYIRCISPSHIHTIPDRILQPQRM